MTRTKARQSETLSWDHHHQPRPAQLTWTNLDHLVEPYHLLDPLFRRVPWPFGRRVEAVTLGPVRALRMARLWGGRELMAVHCFAVGDTLVDAGLACYAPEVVA